MTTTSDESRTPFHRLARESTTFEHWRLPVAAVLAAVTYGVVSVALAIVLIIVVAIEADSFDAVDAVMERLALIDLTDPALFAFLMVSVIVMAPSAWLPVRILWREHTRYLLSVEGRLRWRWLLRCTVISLLVIGTAIGAAVGVGVAESGTVEWAPFTARSGLMVVLVLLLTPLQSAAEEYVFRGAGLQLVGSWVRSPILPIVATTVVFAAGHLYDFWGLVDVALFGLAAAWLTIRTGGLEAAIAAHVVNNVLLFLLGIVGLIDPTGGESVGPLDVLPTAISMVLLVLVVTWQAGSVNLITTRAPQPPRPAVPTYPPLPRPMAPPRAWAPPPGQLPPPGWAPPPPWPAPPRPRVHVPPNAPEYPGELTDGWR
ncbi:CPBP family intramembrane metalloprotease [Aeromicrobium camelliae]|uniref:CPBP family intramembrane metalloprotease n=1 Tax=Aeromicrobium camelliae TaxID=1538144 RepID=A0A3N6WP23_9ACTN|nr:type II CAAX endopeptidase family protein [Aeromicrobium camelliae]RQN09040.1 CPBP family intramembrane metalloprotease [Aeromicrobium camelliae]